PWREIALPLLFGIVIMYRVSLPLGATFLIMAGVITYLRGLSGMEEVVAYIVAALMAVSLSNRVFARRSLVALGGFAFGTAFVFTLAKTLFVFGENLVEGGRIFMGTSFLHVVFAVSSST